MSNSIGTEPWDGARSAESGTIENDANPAPDVLFRDAFTAETPSLPLQDGGTDATEGTWYPVAAGPSERVWSPANNRYINEPTLVRTAEGTWHLFSNGGDGPGEPWGERQLLHATAPSLRGPWRDEPDILTTRDPDATEGSMHAPFAFHDGRVWKILYFDSTKPVGQGLRVAWSNDLFRWTRERDPWPGGRDPMLLRTRDGRELLFTTAVEQNETGIYDVVLLHTRPVGGSWDSGQFALRNPTVCPHSCWGWYESPFLYEHQGTYFLFSTFTSTAIGTSDYERTAVFRSTDPTRFVPEVHTSLQAHGAEVHEENGMLFLTHAGWPARIGAERRGLSLTPLRFERR